MTEQCRQSLVYVLKHRNFFYLRELETNVRGMESVVQLPAEEVADVGTLEGITAAANKHQMGGQIAGVVQARSISVPFKGCRYASVYVVLEIPLDTTVAESLGGRFRWLSIFECERLQRRDLLCGTDLAVLGKVLKGQYTPFQQLTELSFKELLDEENKRTLADPERALLDFCGLDEQDCELVIQLFVHYSWPNNFLMMGSFRKLVAELKLIPDAERVDSYFRAFDGAQRGVLGFNQLLFGLGAMHPANEDGLRYRYVFRQFAENVDRGMTGDEFRLMIADILRARARSDGLDGAESVTATQVNAEAQAYAHLLEKGEQLVLRLNNFLDQVAMRQLPGVSGLFRSCAGIGDLIKKYAVSCERPMPKLEHPFQDLASDRSALKSRTAGRNIRSTCGSSAANGNEQRWGLKRNMVEDAATLSSTGTGAQTGESSTPPVKKTNCTGVPEDPPGTTPGVVREPVIKVTKFEEVDLDSPPLPGTGTSSRTEQQEAGVQKIPGASSATRACGGATPRVSKSGRHSEAGQGMHPCRVMDCLGKFKNHSIRVEHEKTSHKAYICDWCGKSWSKDRSFWNHVRQCRERKECVAQDQ